MTYTEMIARDIRAAGWTVEYAPVDPTGKICSWIARATRGREYHQSEGDSDYWALHALARSINEVTRQKEQQDGTPT